MVSSIESLKDQACRSIDELAEKLVSVSKDIWENPELGLQEFKASALLCDVLDQSGLPTERGIAGLPTAFRAEFDGSEPGPRVAILAEYDALPGMGHACGHNIIASSALGATLALNLLRDQLPGSVRILGTPRRSRRSKAPAARCQSCAVATSTTSTRRSWSTPAPARPQLDARPSQRGR